MDGAHLVQGLAYSRHRRKPWGLVRVPANSLRVGCVTLYTIRSTAPPGGVRQWWFLGTPSLFLSPGMKRGWRSSRSRTGSCPCRMVRASGPGGFPAETIQQWGRGPGHWTSLMCYVCSPEPLYQTYRAAVLSEELWGVSEDGVPSSTNPGEAPTFARPPGPRNTLWQELPAVRASGLLDTLSPQERRMQEVGAPGPGRGEGRSVGPASWAGWELGLSLLPCSSSSEPLRGGDIGGLLPAFPAAADRHLCAEPGSPGHAHPPGSPHPLLQRAASSGSQRAVSGVPTSQQIRPRGESTA